jgi:formylglycine-generating enzyme required for sulfatase activity
VLDKNCVGCHNGAAQSRPDLRDERPLDARGFSPSYLNLHPFVRRPGPESDYHLLPPTDYHADTSELIQMLQKGHHNVQLDHEGWDRLITWIDLNAPCLGSWSEERPIPGQGRERRNALKLLYANFDEDWETLPPVQRSTTPPATAAPLARREEQPLDVPGWPFDSAEAARRQAALGETSKTVDLGDGVSLALVKIPAGAFVMGDANGELDEAPRSAVRVDKPFWMGRFLVTNEQFAKFDAQHDSRYISEPNKDQTRRGIPINLPQQPVVRIAWAQAKEFCAWLSARTGLRFTLPSEAQYEWAARAGTATPFFWGGLDDNFAPFANLADASLNQMARGNSPRWQPKDERFNDGSIVTSNVGRYKPNPWGLYDMIGNAWEWTASTYRPYPYDAGDGREAPTADGRKVCRGGSWYDRPKRSRVSFRLSYPSWQPVYNVGFRVLCEVSQ